MPIDKKELDEALECMEMKSPCVVHDALRDRQCAVIIAIALRESQAQVRAAERVIDCAETIGQIVNNHIDEDLGQIAPDQLFGVLTALSAYRSKYPEDTK